MNFNERKRMADGGKAARQSGGFCLARPWKQGINGLSTRPPEPRSGAVWQRQPIFRECEDASLRNLGNFFIGKALRVLRVCNARIPFSRLPMGFLGPLKGRKQGCVLFVSVFGAEAFAEIRKAPRCETQKKRQDESAGTSGAGGAFAEVFVSITDRKTAWAPGQEKNGGKA